MDTEDGSNFIKNLSYYVRTHEKALANALQLQPRPSKQGTSSSANAPSSNSQSSSTSPNSAQQSSNSTNVFTSALPYLGLAPSTVKPAKLYLTPNQLYYLLSRFEDLGVSTGPMNVRLENIHADHTPSNYVSFLAQAQRPKGRSADQDSIHSVSSVRSVMSTVSSMWSSLSLTNSTAKQEKRKAAELEDLRYLYSAFTKIPCLKLALDHRVPRIADYEEFPFDTAVPLQPFKNVSALEIVDLDFRTIYGWDRLAEQLRSLTVKRGSVEDLYDLLYNVVLDDAEGRRKRSAKTTMPHPIPRAHAMDVHDTARSASLPDSPENTTQGGAKSRPLSADLSLANFNLSNQGRPGMGPRVSSISPPRPTSSRRGSAYAPGRQGGKRQTSGDSTVRLPVYAHRSNSSTHSLMDRYASKWRMLRHLSIADNSLTTISRQSLMPLTATLQSLDLSSNLFTEIPDTLAALVSLRALNLSNCMIESLHSLARSPLPAITVLNLRGNRITSLAGIEKLLSLERLDLRENKIKDPSELARLTGMPNFQEVFVNRNPFVKTHTNYKIKIFNLFRNVPGYEDDITIDGSGPSYSERRQLVDRAQESVSAPVIKPPLEEDEEDSASTQIESKTTSYTSESMDEGSRTKAGTTIADDASVRRRNKRKGAKRRIVDIAATENLQRLPIVLSPAEYTTMPMPSSERHASISQSDTLSPVLSPMASSPDPRSQNSDRQWPSDTDSTDPSLSGETYKKRVENLKAAHGADWLSAHGDEGWRESHRTNSQSYAEKELGISTPVSPALSATNQPIMASSRRLG